MGKINGVFESENHVIGSLLFGNNEFRTESLVVAEPGEGEEINITDGTVLTRDVDGNLVVAEDTTSGSLYILCNEISTPITAAGTYPVRVVESGRVDRRRVNVAGADLTDADVDALRLNGILAEDAYSVNE